MEKETRISSASMEMVVKDPGLRRLYLNQAPDAYDSLWKQHGVDEESRMKNRERLLETINNPNLPKERAKSILSILWQK